MCFFLAEGTSLLRASRDSRNGRARRAALAFACTLLAGSALAENAVPSAVPRGTISITGQVRAPGSYDLLPAEHLSEALMRAGGLTEQAYPYGAVFLRQSIAREERQLDETVLHGLIQRCAQELDPSSGDCPRREVLESAAAAGTAGEDAGRITVVADPAVLATDPDKDPLLEPGDSIFIPTRPTTVAVRGAVSHPGNYPYGLRETVAGYVTLAGGYTGAADDGSAFVIYPDGTAKQIEPSWFYFLKATIPPGSTIVVPQQR